MRQIVFWTAAHIFRVKTPLVYQDSGSGDKTFDWVLAFCLLIFAAFATSVWSVVDRKRKNYATMHKWFRLFLRFCLAGQMIIYGLAKAVPMQMPFPYLTRFVKHYGDFSPMGVLWSSIGASPSYEMFTGCAELLGGILLVIPRTTTLGALVCLADATQVFALNMTYDVPVKLLSFHLILLTLLLLGPDLKRLVNFFFLNQAAGPSPQPPLFTGRRANHLALAAQVIFAVWLVAMNAYGSWMNWYEFGGGRPKSYLYGIWEVDQQSVDGQLRQPLLTDYDRWHRVIFDFPTQVTFQHMDDSFASYGASINVKDKALTLSKDDDKNWKANFAFEKGAPDELVLDGKVDGHRTHMQLKLVDRSKFLLVSRGFHWIQEYPFNR